MDEFEFINQFAKAAVQKLPHIEVGIGDDCAVLAAFPGQLVVSTDTMNEGRHFPGDCPADIVARRALAAAASDLAAMGAHPLGYTLSLSLPEIEPKWCKAFYDALHLCGDRWQMPLLGGDTVRGPLSVSVTVLGRVSEGQGLLRSGALPGDDIWLSGQTGEAAAGLSLWGRKDHLTSAEQGLFDRYSSPEPRLRLGMALSGIAHAAIDISDGLLADAGHIAESSSVSLRLQQELIPVSAALRACAGDQATEMVLAGGDDYELCFTAAPEDRERIMALTAIAPLTRIGSVAAGQDVSLVDRLGNPVACNRRGFNHFSGG